MSEVLAPNIEPLAYDPDRCLELFERYFFISDRATSEERDVILDEAKLQLQSDVASLRSQLTTTFEGLLAQDAATAAWHMAQWEEHGFAHGGFGRPRQGRETRVIGEEARGYLRQRIKETAQANSWQAFFPKEDRILETVYGTPSGLTWRMEQSTYIFDGQRLALIGPTLFQMKDGSVLGDSHRTRGLGPSHLREHAELRTVLPINGDHIEDDLLRKQPFKLEGGIPEGRVAKGELEFLERVLAAYY